MQLLRDGKTRHDHHKRSPGEEPEQAQYGGGDACNGQGEKYRSKPARLGLIRESLPVPPAPMNEIGGHAADHGNRKNSMMFIAQVRRQAVCVLSPFPCV